MLKMGGHQLVPKVLVRPCKARLPAPLLALMDSSLQAEIRLLSIMTLATGSPAEAVSSVPGSILNAAYIIHNL